MQQRFYVYHVLKACPVFTIWTEWYLFRYLEEHYNEMGFEEIVEERTSKYKELQKIMGFRGFPDFLVRRKGKWLRLEVENFTSSYNHPQDYCDLIFCYYINRPLSFDIEIIELKKLLKVDEIFFDDQLLELAQIDERFTIRKK